MHSFQNTTEIARLPSVHDHAQSTRAANQHSVETTDEYAGGDHAMRGRSSSAHRILLIDFVLIDACVRTFGDLELSIEVGRLVVQRLSHLDRDRRRLRSLTQQPAPPSGHEVQQRRACDDHVLGV